MNDLHGNQDLVIRYLLGDVNDEERDLVGEKSFLDPEYSEFIDAVELELIELYIRDRLDQKQRSLFQEKFLASRERREKLAVMRMMLSVDPRPSVERRDDVAGVPSDRRTGRRWLPGFLWNRPVLVACTAVAVAVLMVAQVFLIRGWWRNRDAPLIAMGELSPKLHVQSGRGGSNIGELVVRSDQRYVLLILSASGSPGPYLVELQSDGKALWREENASSASMDGQPVISIMIPAALFRDGGEYVVAWQSVRLLSSAEPNQARYRVKLQH